MDFMIQLDGNCIVVYWCLFIEVENHVKILSFDAVNRGSDAD